MDQIADMLIMIKNASLREHPSVTVPFSKVKNSIATCLVDKGYLKGAEKKMEKGFPVLTLALAYNDREPKVHNVKRISKPSRRLYIGSKSIKSFKNGYGMTVLSTPKGILSDKDAKKELVGGEILFSIW